MPEPDSTLSASLSIPDKLYFKIGEVAQIVGVQPHVLRYWEKEIPAIRPTKSRSNQRRYRRRDVEIFCEIKRLLHEERYTLAGARRNIAKERGVSASILGTQKNTATATDPPHELPTVPSAQSRLDETTRERMRRVLRELIRLAGEEP